jgi:hypothetical protein
MQKLFKNEKIVLSSIFIIFSISFLFTTLVKLPFFGTKVQITEIIFLLCIPILPIKKIIKAQISENKNIFYLLILLILFQYLSSLFSNNSFSILVTTGRLYLLFLFFFFYYFSTTYLENNFLVKIFIFIIYVVLFIFIIGLFQLKLNLNTNIFSYFENYPYFGSVFRLQGFNTHPNMLANILIISNLFLFNSIKNDGKYDWFKITAILLSCFLLFLTFSKSLNIYFISLFIIFLNYINIRKRYIFSIYILMVILNIFFTHVIIAPSSTSLKNSLINTNFTSDKLLYEDKNFSIIETGYLNLKKIEIQVIRKNFFFGVGNGLFNQELNYYKEIKEYPVKLPNFDPHCTYLGFFSENGFFATIILIIFLSYIFYLFYINNINNDYNFILLVIFISFLIEAISTDILNYRHFWFFLAIILAFLNNKSKRHLSTKFSIHG